MAPRSAPLRHVPVDRDRTGEEAGYLPAVGDWGRPLAEVDVGEDLEESFAHPRCPDATPAGPSPGSGRSWKEVRMKTSVSLAIILIVAAPAASAGLNDIPSRCRWGGVLKRE